MKYTTTYNYTTFSPVLEVAIGNYVTIEEGDNVTVCASYTNTPLDRPVDIQFAVLPVTPTISG